MYAIRSYYVYSELLRMAEPDTAVPDLWVIRPLPPVREIASRVSTTRETAARALAQLYPRITSYNVCYTKLLRVRAPCPPMEWPKMPWRAVSAGKLAATAAARSSVT